jgi:DNA-binding response OmpR family regulator
VIEDEPLILDIMARILGTQGHTVALAPNGEEGISLFEKGRYDMVFTDLGMPGMSGWDVARAIKDRNNEVPVIMITGWGAAIDPADVLNKGVDGIVAKPFNVQGLLDVVQKFL